MSIGLAEYVAESFTSMTELSWLLAGDKLAIARFQIGPTPVRVEFEQTETSIHHYQVRFSVDQDLPRDAVESIFAIFNGVFQAVEEFLEIREPQVVTFVTKRPDLAHIYETYLRKEAERIKDMGYSVIPVSSVAGFIQYGLQRIVGSRWHSL